MIEMKNINARINECKLTNKNLKEDPSFDVSNANQFYNLRNLMMEVGKEMEMQLQNVIWNYENPKEINDWTAEHIRENARQMFKEAEKYGLENMQLSNNRNFDIDGVEYVLNFANKALTIDKVVENTNPNITNRQFDYEQIYAARFDTNLDMVNAYFDMVDNDYQLIQDIVAEQEMKYETLDDITDAFIEKMEDAGWDVAISDGYISFAQYTPAGEDFSFDVEYHDGNMSGIYTGISDYAYHFDTSEHIEMWIEARNNGVSGVPDIETLVVDATDIQVMLEEASDIASDYAKKYNQLDQQLENNRDDEER